MFAMKIVITIVVEFRGFHGLPGVLVHLDFQNPGIPSPGGGIKRGLPREFSTQSDHLVNYLLILLIKYEKGIVSKNEKQHCVAEKISDFFIPKKFS